VRGVGSCILLCVCFVCFSSFSFFTQTESIFTKNNDAQNEKRILNDQVEKKLQRPQATVMPRFHVPDSLLQHPELLEQVQAMSHLLRETEPKEAQKAWATFLDTLEAKYKELNSPGKDLTDDQATVVVRLYYENDKGKTDSIVVDEVHLGLLRRPERITLHNKNGKLKEMVGKHIKVDSKEFEDMMYLLHGSNADSVVNMIHNVHSTLLYVVIGDFKEVKKKPKADGGLKKKKVARMGADLLSHPHIAVRVVVSQDGKTVDFHSGDPPPIETNPQGGDCLIRAILETFKPGYDAIHKKKKLTHDAFAPLMPTPGSFECSLEDVQPWLKKEHLSLTAFDRWGRTIMRIAPQPEDGPSYTSNLIRPNHCYVAIHNSHAYRLNHNLNSLAHKKIKEYGETGRQTERQATMVRAAPLHIDADNYMLASSWDELAILFRDTQHLKDKRITIHYNADMEELFFWLKDQYGFEPDIRITGESITGLVLHLQNTYVLRDFPIHNPDEGRRPIEPSQYRRFVAWLQRLTSSLLGSHLMSSYSPNLCTLWQAYPKAQLHRRFVADAPAEAVAVDVVRAYTRNLADLDSLPVFNELDDLQAWDPACHTLEPDTFYLVENRDPGDLEAWFIANRTWSLVSGAVLLGAGSVGRRLHIHSFVRPCHLASNPAQDGLLEELYADTDLAPDLKKFLPNMIIGLMNRKYTQSERAVYTTDSEEADHFGGTVAALPDDAFLAIQRSERIQLSSGFLPMGFLVYDRMRLRMLQLYQDLKAAGVTVFGIATDAFLLDRVPKGEEWEKRMTTGKTWEDVGMLHIEAKKKPVPLGMWGLEKNELVIPVLPPRTFKPTDELVPGTLVTGVLPGCGKTHLLATSLPHGSATLFLTATNEQAERIRINYGHETMTLCHFLGFRVGNDGLTQGARPPAIPPNLKNIVVDEVYQQSVILLGRLRSLPEGRALYATGDRFQTSAGDAFNNMGDRTSYLQILASMWPHEMQLETSHRITDPTQNEKLKQIHKDLFYEKEEDKKGDEGDEEKERLSVKEVVEKHLAGQVIVDLDDLPSDVEAFLTLRNMTAHVLNKRLAARSIARHGETEERITTDLSSPWCAAERATRRVVCKTHHRLLVVNREYDVEVVSDDERFYELKEVPGKRFLRSWFRPPFCRTTHSVQGSTLSKPYAILDVTSVNASREWFWTALTRTDDLKKVWVYLGPVLGGTRSLNLKARLDSHKATDEASGRPGFDLTPSWVLATLKEQNYCCAICHGMLDLEDADDPEHWSIDRKSNDRAHLQGNCQITHRLCNTRSH
jgi:hypothetical protein